MALKGVAKATHHRLYMRERSARQRANRRVTVMDKEVLRLAIAEYTAQEIAESLGISEGAAFKALERVAEFLAPTPASKLSIDPADCLPFVEEIFA